MFNHLPTPTVLERHHTTMSMPIQPLLERNHLRSMHWWKTIQLNDSSMRMPYRHMEWFLMLIRYNLPRRNDLECFAQDL